MPSTPSENASNRGDNPVSAPEPESRKTSLVLTNHNFRAVLTAAAISKFGTQISYLALPVLALTVLHASAGQVGVLATLTTAAFLVVGLPAGALVDRMRRRRVQIVADLVRAALLFSVPIAWALDHLTLAQLYVVAALSGVATVFFDVAGQSFLPQIVRRTDLVAANSLLGSTDAVNQVAGRSIGGFLIQIVSAPGAVVVDAASYLWSAWWLLRVRHPDPKPDRQARNGLWSEVRVGLRFVAAHPILRPLAVAGALTNLSVQLNVVILPVIFLSVLHLSVGALGLYLAVGGVGVFLGSVLARRTGAWLGNGRAMWVVALVSAPVKILIPFIGTGPMLWAAAFGWLLATAQVGINNALQISFRQRATPDGLLGRMNATMRFLLTGSVTVGAALAGLIGQYAGPRAVLWAGAIGLTLVWLPPFLSPMRTMRDLPS